MNRTAYFTLTILIICSVLITLVFLKPLRHLESLILDQYFHFKKADTSDLRIMIVSIDPASIAVLGDMPWSSETHIELLDKISSGNPGIIVYSLRFSDQVSDQIAQHLMGSDSELLRRSLLLPELLITDPYDETSSQVMPAPEALSQLVAGSGIAHVETGRDGVCRDKALAYEVAGEVRPALELEVFLKQHQRMRAKNADIFGRQKINLGARQIKTDEDYRIPISYVGPARTFPYIPAYKILNGEMEPQIFQGKIILIGTAGNVLERGTVTPTTRDLRMPDVEIHANAIHTLLAGRLIGPVPPIPLILLNIFFSITIGSMYRRFGAMQGLLLMAVLPLAIVLLAYGLFITTDMWLYVLPFLTMTVVGYVYVSGVKLVEISAITRECIIELSSQSETLYQRRRSAVDQDDFWKNIARACLDFLNVDSVLFLERAERTQVLRKVYCQPDNAWKLVKQSEHVLNAPPYDYAVNDDSPVVIQDFMLDAEMDTLLVPLVSSHEIIGYCILNKANGRAYFEERRESIIYLARQIALELVKCQVNLALAERARSPMVRLVSTIWQRVGTTEIKSLTQSILEERTRIAAALNGVADGVILYDLFGQLVLYNDKAREFTKGIVADLANKGLHELALELVMASGGEKERNETRDEITEQVRNVILRKQDAVFLITTGEHPVKYYQLTLSVIEELNDVGERHAVGIACAISDISIYEQIADFKQLLQTISERGRNHLTPIIGYAPLIKGIGELSDKQEELLEIIHRNANAMAQIFDEFKEKLSVESGIQNSGVIPGILESKAPVDVGEIAREVINRQQENSEVKITMNQPSPLIERVWGDKSLLSEAMNGLVDSLRQHMPEDESMGITVEWEESNHIRVDISTEGYGVPQEAVQSTLEQLKLGSQPVETTGWQSHSPGSQTAELTLPQINHIIEVLHGGELNGESRVAGGMRFTFRLPTVV